MKLIDMTCPHCGAKLKVDKDSDHAVCEYCRSTILIEGRTNDQDLDAEEAGYLFEKGRLRAKAEAGHSTWQNERVPYKRKRRTWLWVLGWLFIFPVPLTILLLRKKDMNKILKYGLIAAAWIFYLSLAMSGESKAMETGIAPCYVMEQKLTESLTLAFWR